MSTKTESEPGVYRRMTSGTAFACVLLAFLLPFGSVTSCSSSEEIRFTGVELATWQVPPDDATRGTLHEKVEEDAGLLALFTFSMAIIGLALAIAGRVGGGVCAGAGLVGLQLIVWVGVVTWDGFDLYEGYWLSMLAFAIGGTSHLVAAVRARRRAGRRSWTYALRSTVLALLPTLAIVGLVIAAGLGGG